MAFSSFAELRKSRGTGMSTLMQEIDKMNSGGYTKESEDDRFWQPEADKFGNGQAIIRFLTAPRDNTTPWVRVFNHGFKSDAGKWFIEKCPTTLNKPCYCCEQNNILWETNIKANQDIVRERKRKLQFISNVLIVKDSKHPENEGKVKLFRYGKKIFDKLKAAMNPTFDDVVAFEPFDMWSGANFNLRFCVVDKQRNYDQSSFAAQSAISDDDEEIDRIWQSEYDLRELVSEDKFKSYEDIKKNYTRVMGSGAAVPTAQQQMEDALGSYIDDTPAPTAAPQQKHKAPPIRQTPPPAIADDEDAYFNNLLNDDD